MAVQVLDELMVVSGVLGALVGGTGSWALFAFGKCSHTYPGLSLPRAVRGIGRQEGCVSITFTTGASVLIGCKVLGDRLLLLSAATILLIRRPWNVPTNPWLPQESSQVAQGHRKAVAQYIRTPGSNFGCTMVLLPSGKPQVETTFCVSASRSSSAYV
jgi:hypothetical protein